MWTVISAIVVVGFFVLAYCLRPAFGEGFEWTCWWPCRKRKSLWRKLRGRRSDDDDEDSEYGDRVDR